MRRQCRFVTKASISSSMSKSSLNYPDFPVFLTEVDRVLRPGGTLLFADYRRTAKIAKLQRTLEATGYTVEVMNDITAGIVRGLELNRNYKQNMIEKYVPYMLRGIARGFAGLSGEKDEEHHKFRSGEKSYLMAVLRKPAASIDITACPCNRAADFRDNSCRKVKLMPGVSSAIRLLDGTVSSSDALVRGIVPRLPFPSPAASRRICRMGASLSHRPGCRPNPSAPSKSASSKRLDENRRTYSRISPSIRHVAKIIDVNSIDIRPTRDHILADTDYHVRLEKIHELITRIALYTNYPGAKDTIDPGQKQSATATATDQKKEPAIEVGKDIAQAIARCP